MDFKIDYLYRYENAEHFCVCVETNNQIVSLVSFKDIETGLIWTSANTTFFGLIEMGPVEDFPEYFI